MTHAIRVRAGLAVIQDNKILLVPHYNTTVAPVLWYIPGGGVEFGEKLSIAAVREFQEETGLTASATELINLYERIVPEQPWHSITFTYSGVVTGGSISAELTPYAQEGDKTPRWFSEEELNTIKYHPPEAVEAAFLAAKSNT